ncbi:MAG TPA: hypothetical protein PKV48_05485 [Thermodesulfobacteriota bacterium]|nr:hypothetical protein [Thermodesulfobacteriota bacterium]
MTKCHGELVEPRTITGLTTQSQAVGYPKNYPKHIVIPRLDRGIQMGDS